MEEWVKLSVRYYADKKVEALPDADTELMFVRGLARAGELQLEGFIPEESLPKLARRRRHAASVKALLAAGLWTRVEGGFRVTNWDHWQDGLDALARRRAADRERQRRRRASAGESTPEPLPSRDIGAASRDMSRDVTLPEEEEERDLRGSSRSNTHVAREASPEPPQKCPEHLDDPDPPPCGRCKEARQAHDLWQHERVTAASVARSQAARQRAEANRAEIDACPLCDHTGYTESGLCTHDPGAASRVQRGAAMASAAIRKPRMDPRRNPFEPLPDKAQEALDALDAALETLAPPKEVPDDPA